MLFPLIFFGFLSHSPFTSVLEPSGFSFPSFSNTSCSDGSLICTGSVTAGDGYLSITPKLEPNSSLQMDKVGRVLYHLPVLAWPAVFYTTFTVKISTLENTTGAEGMAFVLAQDSKPSPSDSNGAYIGLLDRSTEGGVVRQLGVELDTYMNEFDPDDNHMAIDTTSVINPITAKSLYGTGIDLKSGRPIQVKINYDGIGRQLQIAVAYAGETLVSFMNQSISLEDTVPSSVYVGFTASTGNLMEDHQVLSWDFTSIPIVLPLQKFKKESDNIKDILVIAIPICTSVVLLAVCTLPSLKRSQQMNSERTKRSEDIENKSRTAANVPKLFTYKNLSKATSNFSKENLLGTGGFGSVYKGVIADPPTTIAVKKISATSKQGEREYLAEICTIGRLRHKNIVQLQGWCHEGEHLLLVYEYMPNGSLDRYISKTFLDWQTRYQILTGLASSLLYLHKECGNPVVHRDVKPNNIMLDSDFNAHLGDFGLARLLQNDSTVTTMLAGTPGYLAPESAFTGKATPESDVYSFGMVVLEVVCGRRSNGFMEDNSLVDSVWDMHSKNGLFEGVDKKLQGKFDEEQVRRSLVVGLACLNPEPWLRPSMRKVVQIFLNPNEPLVELPETRPTSINISMSSSSGSTTTNLGSKSDCVMLQSPDEIISVQVDA